MDIWITMFISSLIIPVLILCFGIRFAKAPPKDINILFGYRTRMSMKNQDTWVFAHNHIGKQWRIIGMVVLIPTVIAMILLRGKEADIIGIMGSCIMVIQIVFVIIPAFFTEKALKENFDKEGNRK